MNLTMMCADCGRKLWRYNQSGYCQSCWCRHLGKERMGDKHHAWVGDNVGYMGMHDRIFHRRGKADANICIDCGDQASEWSHRHRTDKLDPDNYDPRCKLCHLKYDVPLRERDSLGRFK